MGLDNMRIALLHESLNPCGGAERVALAMCKALKMFNHMVDLYVLEKTDWNKIERMTSYSRAVIDNEYVLLPRKIFPGMYGALITWLASHVFGIHKIKKNRYDLIIDTKPPLVPVFTDIVYMHFPSFVPGFEYLYYPKRFLYNTVLRIYSRPMKLISKTLISLFKELEYKPLILTNSKFSGAMIKRFLGVNPIILYPPVDVEKYLPLAQYKYRENLVITISRIEEMKNLDVVIDIAREVKNAKFIIIGFPKSKSVYTNLMKKIKVFNLEERVKILLNISEPQKIEILKKAKIFLYPTKYEHFGIAVVEAMASGLIPVVNKSGGPWLDIVEKGMYGFGFSNVSEAVSYVNEVLSLSEKELEFLRLKCLKKAQKFSYNFFKHRLKLIIEAYLTKPMKAQKL